MPKPGHRRRPGRRSRRSRLAAMTALMAATLICVAAILTQGWLPTARSAKRTVAAKSSQSAKINEVPPTLKPTPKPMPTRAVTSMPPGDWTLEFDDEFNGTSLDTAKWSTGWFGSGITAPVSSWEDDCYDPAQVSEGGGALSLTLIRKTEYCGTADRLYATGLVSTMGKFSFTYGFIEARVWLPGAPGDPGYVANWPGVWADGQNWPEDGEIDIFEGINGQVCSYFHDEENSSVGLGAGSKTGCSNGIFTGGWHTFAVNWEPGIITYYYDGADIGTVTSGVTSAPMFLVLDYDAERPVRAPDTMKVDYVRIWQHP